MKGISLRKGNVAVVSGGASGIGTEIVTAFAAQGARMVLFLAPHDALMRTAKNYMVEAGSI